MPQPAAPRPAATVVLVRPSERGLEVLLTQRPSTMAFAPDVHVFPGGAVDPEDREVSTFASAALTAEELADRLGGDIAPEEAVGVHVAAVRELFEEAGVLLAKPGGRPPPRRDTLDAARRSLLDGAVSFAEICRELSLVPAFDRLAPLSRWVTPAFVPRRFDTRFFVAELPDDTEPTFVASEVVSHRWMTPHEALTARSHGTIDLWPPTSATLQQLEHARSFGDVVERLSPGRRDSIRVVDEGQSVIRVVLPAGGGIAGQPVNAYVVGDRKVVVVDPGDPSEEAVAALLGASARHGAEITGIVVTHADPDHLAGSAGLAGQLHVPVWADPGAVGLVDGEPGRLMDGAVVPGVDVELTVAATPGHRPDHLSLVLDDGSVIAGDAVGPGPTRSILAPADPRSWLESLARLEALRPARLLPGHGDPPVDVRRAIEDARRRLDALGQEAASEARSG